MKKWSREPSQAHPHERNCTRVFSCSMHEPPRGGGSQKSEKTPTKGEKKRAKVNVLDLFHRKLQHATGGQGRGARCQRVKTKKKTRQRKKKIPKVGKKKRGKAACIKKEQGGLSGTLNRQKKLQTSTNKKRGKGGGRKDEFEEAWESKQRRR